MASLFDTYLNTGILAEQAKALRMQNQLAEEDQVERARARREKESVFAQMAQNSAPVEVPNAANERQGIPTFASQMAGGQPSAPRAIDMLRNEAGRFGQEIEKLSRIPNETAYRAKQALLKEQAGVVDKLRIAEKDEFEQNLKSAKNAYQELAAIKTQEDLDMVTPNLPPAIQQQLAPIRQLDGRFNINDPKVRGLLDYSTRAALTQVERYEQEKRVADIKNQEENRRLEALRLAETERANRARQGLEREKLTFDQNKERAVKTQIVTSADGTAKLYNTQTGELIKDMGAVAKPTATFEKAKIERKQLTKDLDSTIAELQDITKKGGLIDQSTGSGAGALYNAAAGFFGQATEGAIAVGKVAPIFDKVLKMVPRFEGPQSDKDTASYKEAAGNLANPAIPNAQKKAAAKEILRLMKARKDQFGMAGIEPAAPAATADMDRWNSTPSGQPFTRPDGQIVIKP